MLTRLQRVFGHPVLSIGIGFPEESEKFCTLGKIALINQHLWHSQEMTLFCDSALLSQPYTSDFIDGLGVLTATRVRHIRFPLSWRPATADNGHWQNRAKTTPISPYQGKMAC